MEARLEKRKMKAEKRRRKFLMLATVVVSEGVVTLFDAGFNFVLSPAQSFTRMCHLIALNCADMASIQDARLKLRGELEAPPAFRAFGSGWISGVLGFVLGLAGFFLVLSLRAPGALAMPETRTYESGAWFRIGLHFLLIAAFLL